MTPAEYHCWQAGELEEIAHTAYDAGDYDNWRRFSGMARVRWLIVQDLDEAASIEAEAQWCRA